MSVGSLWGSLEGSETVRTPAMILQEQAGLLGQLTKEVLEGITLREVSQDSNTVEMSMYIVAPALQRYRVKILELTYNFTSPYPVIATSDVISLRRTARSESDLLKILSDLLTSETVRNIVFSLIAESQMSSHN